MGQIAGIVTSFEDSVLSFRCGLPWDAHPRTLAVADFNRNGKPDIAFAGGGSRGRKSNIDVLLGNGDGTFQPPTTYPAGQYPNSVVAGDFNGDGILDLALSSGGLAIFLGNGDGTLQSPISPDAGLLSRIASLELAAMQKSNRSELSTVTLREYSLLGSARVSGQLRQGKQGPKACLFVSAKHRSRKRTLSSARPYPRF